MLPLHEEGGEKGFVPIKLQLKGGRKKPREVPDHLMPERRQKSQPPATNGEITDGLESLHNDALESYRQHDLIFARERREKGFKRFKWQRAYQLALHHAKVANNMRGLAALLGWTKLETVVGYMAAILHDWGKIHWHCWGYRLNMRGLPPIQARKVARHPIYSELLLSRWLLRNHLRSDELEVMSLVHPLVAFHHTPARIASPFPELISTERLLVIGFSLHFQDEHDALTEKREEGRSTLTDAQAKIVIPQKVWADDRNRYPDRICGPQIREALEGYHAMWDFMDEELFRTTIDKSDSKNPAYEHGPTD